MLLMAIMIVACQPTNFTPPIELTLASFSVMKVPYSQIIPRFEEKWFQEHQQRLSINQSYGGSGAQTRAIVDGLDADVAHLALGLDMQKIAQTKLIEPMWEAEFPNQAIVAQSAVALVTRADNPKQINDWRDLVRPGVRVITADPRSSGVARWIFLALWNSVIASGGTEAEARQFVEQVYRNVPVLARDAQEATSTFFRQGEGDVLLNYENEVLLATQRGMALNYKMPDPNIRIATPVALINPNVDRHGTREVATAFVNYLFSPEAQAEFRKAGFRPMNEDVADPRFPKIQNFASVQDLGGWKQLQKQFFAEGALFDQIYQAK
jgi:sulfate transport system substrate-binding protein